MFGVVYTPSMPGSAMTKSMTGSFYLTETVTLPVGTASGGRVTGTVDLSAYVNVPTGQAIAIESVDFITQVGGDFGGTVSQVAAADCSLGTMLVDLNPGNAFVRADNHSLVASQRIDIDQGNNQSTESQDLYPDNFGPASLSEAFLVVNDTLYLVGGIDGSASVDIVNISARIRCRVVKLSTKDWMAIAIQSTASE